MTTNQTPRRRITQEQTSLLASYRTAVSLTLEEVESWAHGEKLPQPQAQRARVACETLGIEAVWL